MSENSGRSSICKLLVRKRKEKIIIYKLHNCAKQNDSMNLKKHINSVDVNETDEKMQFIHSKIEKSYFSNSTVFQVQKKRISHW